MAVQDETILLHFDIDETPAVQSIKDLRAANTELRKSRDAVNISTKEGQELVQKLNLAIDKNNKTIKDNSSALEKQRQNVGNYTESIKDAAGELNVFGVNVGSVTTGLSKFINPATAAAGALTVLAGLYLKSAAGAEDFARAQGSLNALIDEFSNQVGNAGEVGFLEGTAEFVSKIAIAFTSNSKEIAKQRDTNLEIARFQLEKLRGLEEELIIAARTRKDTEKAAEDARRIRDDEKKSQEERLKAAQEVENQLKQNEQSRVKVLQDQLRAIYLYGEAVGSIEKGGRQQALREGEINFELIKDRDIRIQLRKIQAEQADIQEEINGKLTENLTATKNLRTEEAKRLEELAKIRDEQNRKDLKEKKVAKGGLSVDPVSASEINSADALARGLEKIEKDKQDALTKQKADGVELRRQLDEAELEQALYVSDALTALASIGGEQTALYKAFAISQTAIATYSSATKAFDALAGIPIVGPGLGAAAAAAAIANGLANVAQISGIAAAGGADFITSKPTMLLVGDNPGGRERVTVEPLSGKGQTRTFGGGIAMAGGGSLTFDPRMKDGGIVANQNMELTRQSMIMANMIKGLPRPVVDVVQITKVQNQVEVKQRISRA